MTVLRVPASEAADRHTYQEPTSDPEMTCDVSRIELWADYCFLKGRSRIGGNKKRNNINKHKHVRNDGELTRTAIKVCTWSW